MKSARDFIGKEIYSCGRFFVFGKNSSQRIADSLTNIESSIRAREAEERRKKAQERELKARKCSFISGGDSY